MGLTTTTAQSNTFQPSRMYAGKPIATHLRTQAVQCGYRQYS